MSEGTTAQRRGCGSRLVWIAKAFFTLLLVVGVIVGVTWGGYMIYQVIQTEIARSAESVTTRFDAQESRIDILREEVNVLTAANPGQEEAISKLRQELTAVSTQLTHLDEDLSQQNDMLATLEANVALTLNNDEAAADGIILLNDNLAALQRDFNETSVHLDAFGGEVDGLTGDVAALNETAVFAQESASESETAVNEMAQTLMLFRAWELVSRARLRLLENNPGLAQTDVAEADKILQMVIFSLPEASAESESLQTVQTRLALSTINLANDVALAGTDLETAWDVLDNILAARLQPVAEDFEFEQAVEAETAEPEVAETTVEQTETVTPTATSQPADTATPTPTPSL
ncbi:MAG: hypothetical protein CSA11_02675 [Chloroflexi bacterium]|nr:MAG: hypothetical protein CSA11_02675 [Chloroflexota bacterium]